MIDVTYNRVKSSGMVLESLKGRSEPSFPSEMFLLQR